MCVAGAGATYLRLEPNIKKRYDYGVMIFILTFNLVVVSGVRADEVLKLAKDRLLAIVMGFVVCISVSLFVFPFWTSDELHHSTASKFHHLANTIQGTHIYRSIYMVPSRYLFFSLFSYVYVNIYLTY